MRAAEPRSAARPRARLPEPLRRLGSRLAALALLALVPAACWGGIAAPIVAAFEAQAARKAELEALRTRYAAAAARIDERRALLDALRAAAREQPGVLRAANASVAAASLQTLAADLIEEAGGDVRRMRVLAAESRGSLERVGLQVLATFDIQALRAALVSLEIEQPGLRIERIEVHADGADRSAEPMLTAQMTLYGYRRAE